MKKYLILPLSIVFLITIINKKSIAQNNFRADSTLQIMKKVAYWQLHSWERNGMRWPKYDWTNGSAYAGFMALNKIANDPKYSKAMYRIGEDLEWNTGPRKTMADDYCVAQRWISSLGRKACIYNIKFTLKIFSHNQVIKSLMIF